MKDLYFIIKNSYLKIIDSASRTTLSLALFSFIFIFVFYGKFGSITIMASQWQYFVKITQGSFHQGNEQFGQTAGKQCTCNALFSIVFSNIKNQGNWDFIDINYVLEHGDKLYKESNTDLYLMFNDLPREIELMGLQFYIQYLDHKVGVLNCNSLPGTILDRDLNPLSDGFFLLINEKCVSVTWNKRSFFLFDSHSRDSTGKTNCEGAAYLIKFNSKNSIELFIIKNYLFGREENVQFELQHISINKENKNIAATNYLANRKEMRKNDPISKAKECKRKAQPEYLQRERKRKLTPTAKEKEHLYKATPEVKEKAHLYNATPRVKKKDKNRKKKRKERFNLKVMFPKLIISKKQSERVHISYVLFVIAACIVEQYKILMQLNMIYNTPICLLQYRALTQIFTYV